MSQFFENKKNLYVTIAVALILVLVVSVFVYLKVFKGKSLDENLSKDSIPTEYKLELGVLKSDFFKSLTRYGKYPIEPRFPGRENPFEPYE